MRRQQTLGAWLAETDYHLALSAGFFGFFAHAGFLAALQQCAPLPGSISGSSAGALVGGLWASGLDTPELREELAILRREHFWDPAPGLGLLRGRLFRNRLESLLRTNSFSRTRVPFSASVFDLLALRTVPIRHGELAAAICASCALPGLFHPVRLHGRPCIDGGVADRPAHAGIAPSTRVLYHHLATSSPWHRRQPAVAWRPGMVTVVLEGLPRPGPFRLQRGMDAFEFALARACAVLNREVDESGGVLVDQGR